MIFLVAPTKKIEKVSICGKCLYTRYTKSLWKHIRKKVLSLMSTYFNEFNMAEALYFHTFRKH